MEAGLPSDTPARSEAERRDRELADLRELLRLRAFREFLWRLFARTGLFRQSFTGNSWTFFNEGQRSVGNWVFSECLSASPDPREIGGLICRQEVMTDDSSGKRSNG